MFSNAIHSRGEKPTGCGPTHAHHRAHHWPTGRAASSADSAASAGAVPGGRGRKARRGDIRTAALLLLSEEPRNGYQIMQEVQERSGGVWRASPGSVYPALAQLEDEGLIRSEESMGASCSHSPTRVVRSSRSAARRSRRRGIR